MAADQFNSLGGYSAGIPPVSVVDSNGNVITNVLTTGNVTANVVYATYYRYSNGQPLTTNAAGSNRQLQFNNNGQFGGVPTTSYSNNVLSLGNIVNISIGGGDNGYFLQTDGTGNLTWAPAGNVTGGNGTPGGANSQVQFNDAGDFGGNSGFTFNKTTGTLNVDVVDAGNVNANYFIGDGGYLSNISNIGNLNSLNVIGTVNFTDASSVDIGEISNLHIAGGINGYVLSTDGFGNLTWEPPGAGGNGSPGGGNTQLQFNDSGTFAGSNAFTFNKLSNNVSLNGNITVKNVTANNTSVYGNLNATGNVTGLFILGDGGYLSNVQTDVANYVSQPIQSNITSVGTLSNLSVSGNIISGQFISAANFQTSGNSNVGTLRTTGAAIVNGNLTVSGNASFISASNVNLGSVANVRISGGLNGYFLQTDGLGNLSWQPGGGEGGTTSPGGSNTQIQYNNNGNFAASPNFTFNNVTNTVQVAGELIANSMQLGSGAYKFTSSEVFFASSSSTGKQTLYSIPVTECSGVDFQIIGTDSVGEKRQSVKISSLYYAGIVQYSEYGGVFINGGVGDFAVEYNPGNLIVPPSLDLTVVPDTSNMTVYKMWISILAP